MSASEDEIFFRLHTDKTYASPALNDFSGKKARIADKVIDAGPGFEFVKLKDELVIRRTDAGRFQIKASFLEDSREFRTVTIQKFTSKGNTKEYFALGPSEITALLKFLTNIKRIHFPNDSSLNINDTDLEQLLLDPAQAKRLALDNPQLIAAIARNDITTEDVIALGYRKTQLKVFERLLTDDAYFSAKVEQRSKGSPEGLWQIFFEHNAWIFGYSLSLINFGPLDTRKMEQVVRGRDLTGPGKRVDALLRSKAVLSTTAFVEIKTHRTDLVAEQYRPGIWQPSKELSSAIAQVQGTVAAALEQWRSVEAVKDKDGEPTGETLYTTEPRSFVVCGSLSEFEGEFGVNDRRFNSFERYRRNLMRPEVITFDELFERARLIVQTNE